MSTNIAVSTLPLTVAEGLVITLAPETHRLVRSVTNKSGAIRVSFLPVKAGEGKPSLADFGLKGQAAKGAVKRAKREIGAAVLASMVQLSGRGQFVFRSLTLSAKGTVGVFFDGGDGEDTAALAEAEAKVAALEAKLAALTPAA